MITIDDALAAYARHVQPRAVQRCSLAQALGRVLAEAPRATTDLPMFTQSAVDGYALRSADLASAGDGTPVTLTLMGEVAAGAGALPDIGPGQAARIFTGGRLPPGADTVARQEIVSRDGDRIALEKALSPGEDTRFRGEELPAGATLAGPGTRLTPGGIAALAMAGLGEVSVYAAPRVALLVTGDEVIPPGGTLQPGQIFDANGPLLHAWFQARGGAVPQVHYVADTLDAAIGALRESLVEADLVITTGGVSVGDKDFLREAAATLGVEERFWRVAQKPGMPLYFGQRDRKFILGLPGNPGAVLVGLEVHAARVLALMDGETTPGPAWQPARLAEAFKGDNRRDLLARMRLGFDADGQALLQPLGRQGSHMLSNLIEADVLVRVPPGQHGAGAVLSFITLTP
jgi:molybdopterin molybdotransferase